MDAAATNSSFVSDAKASEKKVSALHVGTVTITHFPLSDNVKVRHDCGGSVAV